jgi:hypothetical protein
MADALRECSVALVLQDISNMPGFAELGKKFDPITADWTYIRWLGNRKGIEKLMMTWDKTVVDRSKELTYLCSRYGVSPMCPGWTNERSDHPFTKRSGDMVYTSVLD